MNISLFGLFRIFATEMSCFVLFNTLLWSLGKPKNKYLKCKTHTHTHGHTQTRLNTNTFTGICWLISKAHDPRANLLGDTKHGSQQRSTEPTPLIYHVNFSDSPCSPCWPDNPCRQLRTNHSDRNGNGCWGSAQCVSGYDTPVSQMEMPQYMRQGAVVLLLLPTAAMNVISLSAMQPTFQSLIAPLWTSNCLMFCNNAMQGELQW